MNIGNINGVQMAPQVNMSSGTVQGKQPSAGGNTAQPNLELPPAVIDMATVLDQVLRTKLSDLAKLLDARQQLLKSLPSKLADQVMALINQDKPAELFGKGLPGMVREQRTTASNLQKLAVKLSDAARFPDIEPALQHIIDKTLLKLPPRQAGLAADALLRLATELAAGETAPDKVQQPAKQVIAYLTPLLQDKAQANTTHPEGQGIPFRQAAQLLEQLAVPGNQGNPEQARHIRAELLHIADELPPEAAKLIKEALSQPAAHSPAAAQGEMQPEQRLQQAANALADLAAAEAKQQSHPKQLQQQQQPQSPSLKQQPPAAALLASLTLPEPHELPVVETVKQAVAKVMDELVGYKDDTADSGPAPAKALASWIPLPVQRAAREAPRLDDLWAVLKLTEQSQWEKEKPELAKAAATVRQLAQSLAKTVSPQSEARSDHTILSMTVPLPVADGAPPYPAHIHVYQQQREAKSGQRPSFETWFRITMETENIGIVDTVFRIYEDKKLDIRVNFAAPEAVDEFVAAVPEIRSAVDGTLEVQSLVVGKLKLE